MHKRMFPVLFLALALSVVSLCPAAAWASGTAKYVFLFIGDGTGIPQRNAAELYLASTKGLNRPEEAKLVMNTFPAQGVNTTYDLSSVIPDSASTATALTTGNKTKSGTICMDFDGKVAYETITEVAKKQGMKVGVISTVSLDHATPAAFYAKVPSRSQMYDISVQMANSGFDYFAGGQLKTPVDKKDPSKPNALDVARENGYKVIMGRDGLDTAKPGDKVIAMNAVVDRDAAMFYSIDQAGDEHVTLAEYVAKGIELLDNPDGFLMGIESGKIDWACHANDAAAAIHDTLAMDEAVAVAVDFYKKHPDETLIVVTGDHETGGMTIGFAGTQYSSFVDKIQHQKMSYIEFGKKVDEYRAAHTPETAKFEDMLPLIEEAFGLHVLAAEDKARLEQAIAAGKADGADEAAKKTAKAAEKELKYSMALTDLELAVLRDAFKQSMQGEEVRAKDDMTYLLYGGYEPLSVKLTTILNNKAGIAWTTYSHTGVPVLTSALGVSADKFNGYYDQTDIYHKMMEITGLAM